MGMLERLLPLLALLSVAFRFGRCQAELPDAATDMGLEFMEDIRPDFLQHAVLDFSWTPPGNAELLSGYELVIQHVPPRNPENPKHSCGMTQESVSVFLEANLTSYTLTAVDGLLTSLPIYTCEYNAMLVSRPGNMSSGTLEFTVEYNSSTRKPLQLKCTAHYDPETVMYTVNATWDLTGQHPLVKEALLLYPFHVNAYRFIQFAQGMRVEENNFTHKIQENDTVIEVTALVLPPYINDFIIIEVTHDEPEDQEKFYWRRPAFPGMAICPPNAVPRVPPFKPSQIDSESIRVDISPTGISFMVFWEPPLYLNGDLMRYELCVGEVDHELEGEAECDRDVSSSYLILLEDLDNLTRPSSAEIFELSESQKLAVQARAVNSYKRIGNWSEAFIIDIPTMNDTVPTGSPTTSSPTSGTSVPVWVFAIIAVIIAVILVALLAIAFVFLSRRYCFHRCISRKADTAIDVLKIGAPLIYKLGNTPEIDEWEIPREDVDLMRNKPLGQGAFGEVVRGVLKPDVMKKLSRRKKKAHEPDRRFSMSCIVAVKMLKADNTFSSEKANFLKEIEMMKNVSGGENALRQFVVNMLGCVTVQEPMLLVLEFVSHGDLQSYLRSIRKKFTEAYIHPQEMEPAAPYLEPSGAYSSLQPKMADYEELGLVTERHLVDFARQIAAGMEYLSSLGIVHRDLACRNVLVGEGKALKVSDFGMSRLLPPDEVYVPTSHGPLPLRWMAIEALFYRHFSTKTDVWSYGVVLWEICTMAGFPYPSISNRDLLEMLRSGYRMEKPETCSEEVYEVMLECWTVEADERPDFAELHKMFDGFLTQHTQDNYPYMEVLSKAHHLEDTTAYPEMQDKEQTPINLDIEITDVDADAEEMPKRSGTNLMRSISHNVPRCNMGITPSESNLSLRSLGARSPMEDMQAELRRQAGWLQVGTTDGQDKVDTRYVDSPTSGRHSQNHERIHNSEEKEDF